MKYLVPIALLFASANAASDTLPFEPAITGDRFDVQKALKISDVGEQHNKINFGFSSKRGEKYQFDLNYKKLASNRSYPTNLDIAVKDA